MAKVKGKESQGGRDHTALGLSFGLSFETVSTVATCLPDTVEAQVLPLITVHEPAEHSRVSR